MLLNLGTWVEVADGDKDGFEIFKRHYSYNGYADGRRDDPTNRARGLFVGPGEKMVLLTPAADALFVWRKFINPRDTGINCAVFRNESSRRASELILEAEKQAFQRWGSERLYTYVNPAAVRGTCPGYCFIRAGWRYCGVTTKGLLVLEKFMGKSKKETNEGGVAVAEAPAGASTEALTVEGTENLLKAAQLQFASITSGEHDIPLALIRESAANPRTQFDMEKLLDLRDSLLDVEIGQVQAATVIRLDEPDANGCMFEIDDGARRFRGAKEAKLPTLRCIIVQKSKSDGVALARRVIANGLREDLNPIERGEAYAKILQDCGGDVVKAAIRAGLGAKGGRVLQQEIQFVTTLIAPAIDALRAGRITRAHAALICRRKSSKDQLRALQMCFEARPIFNGATAENEEILISEKELRGKIASHWQDEGETQKQGALDLGAGAENSTAKDKNDIEREAQQNMERAADELIAGSEHGESAEGEQGQKSQGSDGESPVDAPASPSPDSEPAAPKAVDDDEADEPQQPTDYEKDKAERLQRLGAAFDAIGPMGDLGRPSLRMIALTLSSGLINVDGFCRLFGKSVEVLAGNRLKWQRQGSPGTGTIHEFIRNLEETHRTPDLRRVVMVLLFLPALNPGYNAEEDIKLLEGKAEEHAEEKRNKTEVAKRFKAAAEKQKPVKKPTVAKTAEPKPEPKKQPFEKQRKANAKMVAKKPAKLSKKSGKK